MNGRTPPPSAKDNSAAKHELLLLSTVLPFYTCPILGVGLHMLSATFRTIRGLSNGFALRGMNQSVRHLVIRRQEQKLLFSRDLFFLLLCFNYSAWRNVSPLCSGRVGQILSTVVPYSHYIVFVVSFIFMWSKEKVVNAQENSRVTIAFFSVGDFLVMHMADIVTFITLFCAGIVVYWGGNVIWGAIQILFCALCIAEHKPFWMNPTYNDGFLCTMAAGRVFRSCCAFAQRFRTFRYFMDYLDCGPLGRVWMCIDLVLYLVACFFPQSFTSCWDSFIEWVQGGLRRLLPEGASVYTSEDMDTYFNVLVDSVLGKERLETGSGSALRVSKKLFTPFQCQDPCPNLSLRQLEIALLELVEKVLRDSGAAEELRGLKLQDFYELIGKDKDVGIFSKHLYACVEEQGAFERESKLILYICISALKKGEISPLESFINRREDFVSCPDEVKRASTDLCLSLRASSSHIGGEYAAAPPLDERHHGKEALALFQLKVLKISQQVRDRECTNSISLVSAYAGQLLQKLAQINWGVGRLFVLLCIDIGAEVVDLFKNVHCVVEVLPIFKKELGLITPAGGGSCSDLALKGPVSDSPLWNIIVVTCLKLLFEGFMKYRCAREMMAELTRAIGSEWGDSRIHLLDLRNAAAGLAPDEEGIERNLDKYLKLDPNSETYRADAGSLIDEFLPQLLFILGVLQEGKAYRTLYGLPNYSGSLFPRKKIRIWGEEDSREWGEEGSADALID